MKVARYIKRVLQKTQTSNAPAAVAVAAIDDSVQSVAKKAITPSASSSTSTPLRSASSSAVRLDPLDIETNQRELSSEEYYRYSYMLPPEGGLLEEELISRCREKMKKQTAYALQSQTGEQTTEEEMRLDTDLGDDDVKPENGGIVLQNRSREDAYSVQSLSIDITGVIQLVKFYGVFDGHCNQGGRLQAGREISEKLPMYIEGILSKQKALNEYTITQAITKAVGRLNKELIEENKTIGKEECEEKAATATCVLRIGDNVYIFNVGDSRIVLEKEGLSYQLTEDAKPHCLRFSRAATKMGRTVVVKRARDGCILWSRIDGMTTARDIGLESLSAQPKITFIQYSKESSTRDSIKDGEVFFQSGNHLILASDGFWDIISNQAAAKAIDMMAREGKTEDEIAKKLALLARQIECDNIVREAKIKKDDKMNASRAKWHIDDIAVVVVKL